MHMHNKHNGKIIGLHGTGPGRHRWESAYDAMAQNAYGVLTGDEKATGAGLVLYRLFRRLDSIMPTRRNSNKKLKASCP